MTTQGKLVKNKAPPRATQAETHQSGLCRGLRCAADPTGTRAGGIEASSSGNHKHAGQLATLHQRQFTLAKQAFR
jgi:hypothetical protein